MTGTHHCTYMYIYAVSYTFVTCMFRGCAGLASNHAHYERLVSKVMRPEGLKGVRLQMSDVRCDGHVSVVEFRLQLVLLLCYHYQAFGRKQGCQVALGLKISQRMDDASPVCESVHLNERQPICTPEPGQSCCRSLEQPHANGLAWTTW